MVRIKYTIAILVLVESSLQLEEDSSVHWEFIYRNPCFSGIFFAIRILLCF